MRTILIVLVLTLVATRVALAGTETPSPWLHTRPLTPSAAQLLEQAAERSPAVKAQLEALENTDVVVYVRDTMYAPESAPQAYLRFVAHAGGLRYLIVNLERFRTSPTERIAWLGHELHHALEIAAAPAIQDEAGLRRHYRHIGWQCGSHEFETDAAKSVTRVVRNQLIGYGR